MKRRYRRSYRKTLVWALVAVVALLVRLFSEETSQPTGANPGEAVEEGIYTVKRVVDGDTLLLDSGIRVRLQGIDTPETVREDYPVEPWGPEASQFTKSFINSAHGKVRLTFSAERIDRYGRHLAFAWHGDRLLNEELVRAGLARARLEFRYSGVMKNRLARAQREAKQAGRGIWSHAPAEAGG